ncbi:hypothetical protein ACR6C2_00715 [Streptomyces sp. INA 01156]
MRLAGAHTAVRRIWTVELRPRAGGLTLACLSCAPPSAPLEASSARSAVLTHLARHARTDALPTYLRSCQCRTQGCWWHPRHRGCAGPVLLALTRDRSGRTWRLADTCAACAAATSHTAAVPDTLIGSPGRIPPPAWPRAPQVSSGTQGAGACAGDAHLPRRRAAPVHLPRRPAAGPAVRPAHRHPRTGPASGRPAAWHAPAWPSRAVAGLAHVGWLEPPDFKSAPVRLRLLDAAALDQAPGRRARRRAAHWALHPRPWPCRPRRPRCG